MIMSAMVLHIVSNSEVELNLVIISRKITGILPLGKLQMDNICYGQICMTMLIRKAELSISVMLQMQCTNLMDTDSMNSHWV